MDAFKVLDIPPTATKDEIRAAYHVLARRWHPDRFPSGPERDWANEKMAKINAAYRECLNHLKDRPAPIEDEDDGLAAVQQLIDDGRYVDARRMLMGLNTRCAEWNYLFGAVLLKLSEVDKALIYLSVAAHQKPGNAKYARALKEARRYESTHRLAALFGRRK